MVKVPFKRPEPFSLKLDYKKPKTVRANYLQWIGDIIRSYEYLAQMVNVQEERMGYIGRNLGAAISGVVTTIEPKVKYIEDFDFLPALPNSQCTNWLFQFGLQDEWIHKADIAAIKEQAPVQSQFLIHEDNHRMQSDKTANDLKEWLLAQFYEEAQAGS